VLLGFLFVPDVDGQRSLAASCTGHGERAKEVNSPWLSRSSTEE
jgi:hypothetical protein